MAERQAQASGDAGVLWHHYQVAARLGAWRLVRTADGATVKAPVYATDVVWLARRPLTLTLGLGPLEWEWADVTADIEAGAVRITVTGVPDRTSPHRVRLI